MYLVPVLFAGSMFMILADRAQALPLEAEQSVKVEIDLYYETDDFNTAENHGRVRRGFKDWWKNRNKKDTTLSPKKERKKMDMKITDQDGVEQSISMEMVKTLQPKAEKYVISNKTIVKEDTSTKIPRSYELFMDPSNAGTVMLMSCDETGASCKSMGSFNNGTETLILQKFDSAPYASKGKKGVSSLTGSSDRRIMGIASDGSVLAVPVSTRRKRDINLTSRMRENVKRKRRQAVTSHVVELLILVDYSEYTYWLNRSTDGDAAEDAMELYFILMTNMMDDRFQTVFEQTGDMDIKFMINGFVFVKNEADNPWEVDNVISPGVVNVNKMLDDLTVWTMTNQGYLPAHDHIMAISNLNLAVIEDGSTKTSILGVAWSGSMCNPGYSVSIIEDAGLGLVDYVATHEIGHSLSSTHDVSAGCDDADFFVMGTNGGSPTDGLYETGKESNPWTFSECAVSAISSFVQDLGSGSCLLTSTFVQADYDYYKTFMAPGIIVPIDSQCELVYGTGSRRCFALDASICSDGAFCWNPADPSYCYTLYVRQGTICGDQMRCNHGLCENSTIVMPTCAPETGTFTLAGNLNYVSEVQTTVTPPTSAATTRYEAASSVELIC